MLVEFNKIRTVTGAEECMKTNAPLELSLSLTTKRSLMQAGFVHYLFVFIIFVYFYLFVWVFLCKYSFLLVFHCWVCLLFVVGVVGVVGVVVVICCGGCVCCCCWRCDCVSLVWRERRVQKLKETSANCAGFHEKNRPGRKREKREWRNTIEQSSDSRSHIYIVITLSLFFFHFYYFSLSLLYTLSSHHHSRAIFLSI